MTRMQQIGGTLGLVGLLAAAVGWISDPARFYFAWLAAFVAWLAWPLGALILLLIHALTGGRWGVALRPALRAGVSILPLLLPAIVPLLLGLPTLYPWMRATVPNAFYLNQDFFEGRLAIYVVVWFGLAALVLRALQRGDTIGGLAPAGLILLAFTITFAAIDTSASLTPAFSSSIYGMVELVDYALLGITLAILATAARGNALQAEARIVLGLVVLWAYLDFMQFLIVWESDLPNESGWYVPRVTGFWGWLIGFIVVGHFLLPLAALAMPAIRRSRRGVICVCALLVAMEILRHWWLVLPTEYRSPGWLDLACVAALFGAGTFAAGTTRRRETGYG